MSFKEDVIQKFWDKVIILDETSCWVWKTDVREKHYPEFRHGGARYAAHRFALMATKGMPEKGQHAMHSCDNVKCCNPHHLRWGSREDNFREALQRSPRFNRKGFNCTNSQYARSGEKHGMAKLTSEKVVRIRQLISEGNHWQKDIAVEFGVTPSVITLIKQGKIWNHEQ